MIRRKLFCTVLMALTLAVAGGLVYGNWQTQSYICPITGEALPCAKCCPLNQEQPTSATSFTCPITGEELPCERCCPLNQQK